MSKLKFDSQKQEYQLTLNATQLQLIDTLLAQVQLGTGNKFSNAAYELSSIIEKGCPTSNSDFFKKQIDLLFLADLEKQIFIRVSEGASDAK